MKLAGISGCGIGLRREFVSELAAGSFQPDWIEIVPENWIDMPYKFRDEFVELMENHSVIAHGLSLSLGSPDPVEQSMLNQLKLFFDHYGIEHYSEHLSFSTWHGSQTYELLPVPMTKAMAEFIADKIKYVSDFLNRPLILENAAYYYQPYAEMPEHEFINMVLEKADCPLLLDVNNVYVNSVNHRFDPELFIKELDLNRIAYLHTAGHTWYPEDEIIIDTHGAPVIDEVWNLLRYVLNTHPSPVMIERDNNIPPLSEIILEYNFLKELSASQLRNTALRNKIG